MEKHAHTEPREWIPDQGTCTAKPEGCRGGGQAVGKKAEMGRAEGSTGTSVPISGSAGMKVESAEHGE